MTADKLLAVRSRQIQCPGASRDRPKGWHRSAFALAALLGLASAPAAEFWPGAEWPRATPAEAGLGEAWLETARDYALSAGGSGYITRGSRLVMAWGDASQRYDLKSTTKSLGSIALGLALQDEKCICRTGRKPCIRDSAFLGGEHQHRLARGSDAPASGHAHRGV
jgi:hypothetical protein